MAGNGVGGGVAGGGALGLDMQLTCLLNVPLVALNEDINIQGLPVDERLTGLDLRTELLTFNIAAV